MSGMAVWLDAIGVAADEGIGDSAGGTRAQILGLHLMQQASGETIELDVHQD